VLLGSSWYNKAVGEIHEGKDIRRALREGKKSGVKSIRTKGRRLANAFCTAEKKKTDWEKKKQEKHSVDFLMDRTKRWGRLCLKSRIKLKKTRGGLETAAPGFLLPRVVRIPKSASRRGASAEDKKSQNGSPP